MNEGPIIRFLQIFFAVVGRVAPPLAGRLACTLMFIPRTFKRPQRERDWIERSTPLSLDCGLAAWSWGDPSHPTVLLIHGWSGRGTQMCAFIEPLLSHGRHVIAIDGDAHGNSPGWRTNPIQFADRLFDAAHEIGPLESLIAHSFGAGTSSIAIARGLQTEKMVFIAGPADYRQVMENARGILNIPARAFDHMIRHAEKQLGVPSSAMDITRIIEKLTIPCLVMHSRDDNDVAHSEGEKIARAWPGATMKSFDNLGHMRILWHDKSVKAGVDFVTQNQTMVEQTVASGG